MSISKIKKLEKAKAKGQKSAIATKKAKKSQKEKQESEDQPEEEQQSEEDPEEEDKEEDKEEEKKRNIYSKKSESENQESIIYPSTQVIPITKLPEKENSMQLLQAKSPRHRSKRKNCNLNNEYITS